MKNKLSTTSRNCFPKLTLIGVTAVIIMMPVIISLALFIRFGTETRGLDLRHLEYSRARSLPVPTATSEV